jgi:hypothetical protein
VADGRTQLQPRRPFRVRAALEQSAFQGDAYQPDAFQVGPDAYPLWRGFVDAWAPGYNLNGHDATNDVSGTDGTTILAAFDGPEGLPVGEGEDTGARIERIAEATRAARELEFLYPVIPATGDPCTYIKGFIDLVFEHSGRIYVVDWKSDVLPDYRPAALARHVAAHYAIQHRLYAVALARMIGPDRLQERFGGLIYWFLRGEAAHVDRPDPAALLQPDDSLGSDWT